jgi:uncharacterized Zn-finger protein
MAEARRSAYNLRSNDLFIQRNPVAARAGTVDQNLIPANAQHNYGVRPKDLPLSCPMPGMYLWNSHPKVFLPIEATGEAKCPYCGAQYHMTDADD